MRRLVVLAFALAPLRAAPQEPAPVRRVYAFASVGRTFALDADVRALGLEQGLDVAIGGGIRIAPHVGLELGSGYLRFASARSGLVRIANDPGAPVSEITTRRSLSAVPLAASVRVSARRGRLEAHALGGAGVYFAAVAATTASNVDPTRTLEDGDTCFGLHAGGGVAVSVSPDVSVGVEARYLRATATFRIEERTSSTTVQSLAVEHRLDSVTVAAAAAYRF